MSDKLNKIKSFARKLTGSEEKPKAPPGGGQTGKKRGNYKQKECPFCHAFVGNLGNHIRLKHPAEAQIALPTLELTKENLLTGKKPPGPETVTYYCTSCRAELRKGENPCWNCGAVLVWEGIE